MTRAHQEAGGRYGAPSDARGGVWQLGSAPLIIAPVPKASGGIILEQSGFFTHAFLSSGTFVLSTAITAEILVVAGGGGGGFQVGGGGGAGGVLRFANQSLAAGTYAVTVGNGGAGAANNQVKGSVGGNSQFGSLTAAIGGGGGASHTAGVSFPDAGGSGGGGSGNSNTQNTPGGAGAAGQGNSGGTGMATNWAGGGGGGAGGGGGNASANTGGNGGIGLQFPQFAPYGFPQGWFGGGGGGSMNQQVDNNSFSLPGNGGGGRGFGDNGLYISGRTHGDDGVPNTGGGGGGVRDSYAPGPAYTRAGNGGSGIVIVRYAI